MFKRFFSSSLEPAVKQAVEKATSYMATLKRSDYNGNTFIMRENIPLKEAEELASHYEALGHHQHYHVEVHPDKGFISDLPSLEQSGNQAKTRTPGFNT